MEENSFEKQVQGKMNDLQLAPSPEVWKQVNIRIEKKRNQKWAVLFLLFLLAGLIFGAYGIWENNIKEKTTQAGGHPYTLNSSANNNSHKESVVSNKPTVNKNNDNQKKVDKNQSKDVSMMNSTAFLDAGKEITINGRKGNSIVDNKISGFKNIHAQQSIFAKHTPPVRNAKNKLLSEIVAAQTENMNVIGDKSLNNDSTSESVIHQQSNLDSANKVLDSNTHKLLRSNPPFQDTTRKKISSPDNLKPRPFWQFGFVMAGGFSGMANSLTHLSVYNLYSSDLYFVSVPSPGSTIYPSKIRSGPAITIGFIAERKVTKRVSLSTGINFKHFTTLRNIGYTDTVPRFFNQFEHTSYSSHFNFIELPVSLKYRINKSNSLPIYLEGGLLISQLLNSNAIQYKSEHYYTTNNSLLNTSQIGINTGLSADLFKNNTRTISAGPYFSYNITTVATAGEYARNHFIFAGIRTFITFHKK